MGEIWGRNGRETAVAEWRWAQDHDTTFLWLDAIVLAITVVNFAWTFHPSFVIVKPLLLSISMVLFVTMQM